MKRKRQFETLATIALGVICAVLFLRLATRIRAVNARAETPVKAAAARTRLAKVSAAAHRGAPEAFPQAPALNVALYTAIQSESMPAPERDPFAFTPAPRQAQQVIEARRAAAARRDGPPSPPPPPPVPFQALGFSQSVQGAMEAYLADSQQIYVVRQGDSFDKSYHVLRITPGLIEIEDDSLHRTIGLPFPTQ